MFEYMYMGKAIVAPNQPNIREILEDRKDALLVDPSDHKAMTAAIQQLSEDGALRRQIGARAQATISEKKLYWSNNASTVVELANTALARTNGEYADLMKAGKEA